MIGSVDEYTKKLQACIDHYGLEGQSYQTMEEAAELILALRKYWRRQPIMHDTITVENLRNDIIDELADMQIMIDQMALGYNARDKVDERIRYKLDRQQVRIREET